MDICNAFNDSFTLYYFLKIIFNWRKFSKTLERFLKKLGIKLLYDTEIPLLGTYSEKTISEKKYMYPNVHSSTMYDSQDMDAT